MKSARWIALVVALAATSFAWAQDQTYEIKNGTVIAVSGSLLTVSTPEGTKQFNIPADFKFELDGRQVGLSEITPGTKLTALIRTTTQPVQLTTTELKHGKVVYTNGSTLVVKNELGEMKQFNDKDLRNAGVIIYKNDQEVPASSLHVGDDVSALVVTRYPPEVITQQDLAVLAQKPAPPPPPAPKPAPAAVVAQATPPPPPMPKTGSPLPLIALAGAGLIGLGLGMRFLTR